MYQVIFIAVVIVFLIACCVSTWDDYWKGKCKNEITEINAWLKKYGMTMWPKDRKAGPFSKWVICLDGTWKDAKTSQCQGISFRKLYKALAEIRKDNIANPDFDQTRNLMSLLYKSQMKDVKKSIWED
ncbi:hypothetical protein [Stenotrophomonas phage IME13]|uniref:Uncharacterized protein n=1 Tax=Stenotrophomonas phage IME13 TaxID=1211280 RepID=J7HXH7_9CAUD|nr:hypothetical protein AVU72_gp007 [Stenotrophomonas phage IME13]AFQ22544.1 hypothetical protein [Stenotrophomonas phage IME13]